MKIRVTFHDGPPIDAAAKVSAAKAKADTAVALAQASPKKKGLQMAAASAVEAHKKAEADAAIQPIAELHQAVRDVAGRFGSTLDDSNPAQFHMSVDSPARAAEIMKDPEFNSLAPIQIETV